MTRTSPPTPAVWLGLLLTVASDCLVQFLWKELALELPHSGEALTILAPLLRLPLAWLLGATFLFKFFVWLWVLARAELSFAQPLTSLSYVGVALISGFVLGEHWHWQNILSVLLILLGVYFISDTGETES